MELVDYDKFYYEYGEALIGKSGKGSKKIISLLEEIYPLIENSLKKIKRDTSVSVSDNKHYDVKVEPNGKEGYFVRIYPNGQITIPLSDPYYGQTPIKTLDSEKILEFNPWLENR